MTIDQDKYGVDPAMVDSNYLNLLSRAINELAVVRKKKLLDAPEEADLPPDPSSLEVPTDVEADA